MNRLPRCDATAAWAALSGHYEAHGRELDLRDAFVRDPARFERFAVEAPEVFADLSKNLIDSATLHFLADLARECGVEALRDAMFAGEPINVTEGRAVLHPALRAPPGTAPHSGEVHAVLDAMLAFAETVRARAESGVVPLRHVVNIGIGGSDLGPQMAVGALAGFAHPQLELHFVSNVDGHDIASVLRQAAPRETLFIVASKTFTTQETMANAETAKAWFLAGGGSDIGDHFVAATTNVEAAARFGIARTFGFWDWVGGRYSLWSAIGLPIAIAVGAAGFRELLAGARAMDEHFATTPIERNLPMLLGLVDVWYRNFRGFTSRCVAPYHHALKRLPAFL
ncbi:MAG: glucose-6-phosphate isomerase, partial [Caldimonas sp.]